VTPLTEAEAERHLAAHALLPAHPGFVGLAVDLPHPAPAPAGTTRLRHGFRTVAADRTVVSGPPSPGLDIAVRRMTEDLGATHPSAAVRVSLEAGTDDHGPTGMSHRWAVAHAIAPVLVAAFANSPGAGRRTRRPALPAAGAEDPRTAWARQVLDAPASPDSPATFRDRIRHGSGRPATIADLDRHRRAFRPPVAARGHLEIGVTDRLPGDGWVVAAAVVTTLVDDRQAAAEALVATAALRTTPRLWERALRDALTDPDIAAAARSLFLSAYAALGRRGVSRPIRDSVADYLERYVGRGRCPADDLLATRTEQTRP